MNDINKTIETLEAYNRWRRDDNDDGDIECPDPKEISSAIDDALDNLKYIPMLKEELTKAVNECIKLTRVVNEQNKSFTKS